MEVTYEYKMQYVLSKFDDNEPHTSSEIANELKKKESFNKNVPYILRELKTLGLLESFKFQNNTDIYGITSKGMNVLKNEGISRFLKEIHDKEKLELKILKATDQSHILNRFQLVITIILAAGAIISLGLQYSTYCKESEKTKLEIQKLKIELSTLDNRK